ncbi:hypothetical protein COU78_04395 [Candidatus Peregrinibacteria bacterium CG10_big_fil_rev_8_21_14_0_10_49_24]|nr:MAG: hypothetical protein COV83_06975 [Candidatus Peregrinibacteria bacterium CG11_big_fil_rev_8_21_14_0_20_49_14]PIR50838.1 MAG: hypothetical protein COU78_04395 [Candidatus Peregrinibacteria bacterium CG10_big_fil_rev_8_21_14_0_10_49_24]PJA67398.1 MAG: hypothetical protein CO157_04835 [Candidatus Peregrinibacteria bacterium CG_4_9_14_3_um_filter_49_12]
MAKRPTPKKRRAKSKGKAQHAVYQDKQLRKLTNRQNSPYAAIAEPKNKAGKALKSITKIKA